jgi:hypothetical protein
MSIALIGFGMYSIALIGPSRINIGILVFAVVQTMGLIRRTPLALRLVGIELIVLAFMQLPFYFAPGEGAPDWSLSFHSLLGLFSLGVLVLVTLSGACFEDARLLAAEQKCERSL